MTAEAPYAVLDVGSNTVRLLVARREGDQLEPILDRSAFVRLGLGVDRRGALRQDREQAALEAIGGLAEEARSLGAGQILAIATSAVRDASNGKAFARRVREITGVELEIVSGEREAQLTYLGATHGLSLTGGAVVCDLGGGSAELIAVNRSSIQWARSVQMGSGRLTEQFVRHDPPTVEEKERMAGHVREVLEGLPPVSAELAVFTGGTARHVARLAGLENRVVSTEIGTLERIVDLLLAQPSAEIVARYGVEAERARVLPAGAIALHAIAGSYEVEQLVITSQGIREGVILDALQRLDRAKEDRAIL